MQKTNPEKNRLAEGVQKVLVWTGHRLERLPPTEARKAGLWVDLFGGRVGPRILALKRRQPLAKAVGTKAQIVADATAGMGGDSLLLAHFGYHVVAIERSPVVAELLADGLQRWGGDSSHQLQQNISLCVGDAKEILPTLNPAPDVVYLDPMFPPKRKKSALANKQVRMLRELVGNDDDAPQLLAVALRVARQRVVVKRPTYAPPLAGKPSFCYTGKLVRYDVYGGVTSDE